MNMCQCGCGESAPTGKTYRRGHWSRTPEAKAMFESRRTSGAGPNPIGLCQCGCGGITPIAPRSDATRGWVKGQPMVSMKGHGQRGKTGPTSHKWKGGQWTNSSGYVHRYAPDHPAHDRDGYVLEHRLVMEGTLGRLLEPHERVHHINHIKTDNRPENLQVFSSQSAHMQHHGVDGLRQYHVVNPEARRENGRRGARARWCPPDYIPT